jgi:phosphoglycerate dehydrogenase-like enzyme
MKRIITVWITEDDNGRYSVTKQGKAHAYSVAETATGNVLITVKRLSDAKRDIGERQEINRRQEAGNSAS